MIRVLIVDDSITQREILKQVLEADGDFIVVGQARDGSQVVDLVRECRPDVVVMDIHMPNMDGIEATRQVMSQCPVPIVIASSTLKKLDVDHGLRAIEAGAVSVVMKPEGAALLHLKKIAPELRFQLQAAAQANVSRLTSIARNSAPQVAHQGTKLRSNKESQFTDRNSQIIEAIGVCASTGGPGVLCEIFGNLPKPYPIPILLVQHISQGFVEGFGQWLASQTGQPVGIATEGQRLTPGIWLAPMRRHLALASPSRVLLPNRETADIHCPSGDPLFKSLARFLGPKAVGVQLTGMGNDGAHGLLALKEAGGDTVIQSKESCLIWGMPKVAQELGAANHELSPLAIAGALSRLKTRQETPQ